MSRVKELLEMLSGAPETAIPSLTKALEESLAREQILEECNLLGASGIVGTVQTPSQIYAIYRTVGEPRGLSPAEALAGTHLMRGRISEAASLIWADIKLHLGDSYKIAEGVEGMACIISTPQGEQVISYTYAEAKAAELGKGNKNWSKFPQDMVFARLGTRVANRLGIRPRSSVYTVEETLTFGSTQQVEEDLNNYIELKQLPPPSETETNEEGETETNEEGEKIW